MRSPSILAMKKSRSLREALHLAIYPTSVAQVARPNLAPIPAFFERSFQKCANLRAERRIPAGYDRCRSSLAMGMLCLSTRSPTHTNRPLNYTLQKE